MAVERAPPSRSSSGPIPVRTAVLIGRTRGIVDIVLDHPTVSMRHAKVFRRGERVYVTDLRSTYGTFVDGQRVRHETELAPGARLSIGPFALAFDGAALRPLTPPVTELSLGCLAVRRTVTDRATGRPLTLLHDISLAIRPRELVCLIGPSGSGKSTLLRVLSGRVRPDGGRVVYGGRDLHADFESLKHDVAVVPQREAVHGPLTVQQALWYASGLRLPSDTTSAELDACVERLVEDVGLGPRRHVRIRDLSGGQLKRVSLAGEIAHRPSLVLLDEVTSGLDELGDEEMMQLFRGLAEQGRAVVCITHNTLNIERNAHLVVVLTAGGRLACVASPAEVCRSFGVQRLGDVYGVLASRPPEFWEARFANDPLKRRYVDDRLRGLTGGRASARGFTAVSPRRPIRFARQFRLLAGRIGLLQVVDFRPLAVAAGQAVFVGGMLVALFGDLRTADDPQSSVLNCRNAAFLLVVSVFWFGCNNAAPEIVRERLLFERERAVSVNAATFYLAKLLVLGGLAAAQSLLVYGLMAAFCHIPARAGWPGTAAHLFAVLAAALLGTFTGLAISAVARTEETAVRTVPLVLIPQIMLSNVILDLHGGLEIMGRVLVSTYWTFAAFTSGTAAYELPGAAATPFAPAALTLAVHAAVLVGIAFAGLRPTSAEGRP